jgi:hypothetical protein
MRHYLLAFLIASTALLAPAARAADTEPRIYFFWSASCPYSKAARSFLQASSAKDARLRITDFEVDGSVANMRLLGRLYERIGLSEFWVVPVVVIGHHVVIGYIDDASTGAEILGDVAECRKAGCTDTVRDLIESLDRYEAVAALPPMRKFGCAREPGGAVRY